jgi:hypothetical protein
LKPAQACRFTKKRKRGDNSTVEERGEGALYETNTQGESRTGARNMHKKIAFTAAVLAVLSGAEGFMSPLPVKGRLAVRTHAIARAAPRTARSSQTVRMMQTFTESETWQNTDIPALLKEGAAFFLEDKDVKFTPTNGGVNNLVQYCETSSVISVGHATHFVPANTRPLVPACTVYLLCATVRKRVID